MNANYKSKNNTATIKQINVKKCSKVAPAPLGGFKLPSDTSIVRQEVSYR